MKIPKVLSVKAIFPTRKIRNAFASNRPQIRFLKILGSTFLPKKKMYLETGGIRQKRQNLLYKKAEKSYEGPDDIPFIAKQTRIVLKNCGKFDAESLGEYIASGGFSALSKALFEMTPADVVDQVDKSGIPWDEGAEDSRQERNGSR